MSTSLQLAEMQVVYSVDKSLATSPKVSSSEAAFTYLKGFFNEMTLACQEEFNIMFLNTGNIPLGVYRASRGTISSTTVDIKLILGMALNTLATGIILCHNHPSGKLNPSEADINLTRKIKQACELLDINLLDHIIINPFDCYYSFADGGIL